MDRQLTFSRSLYSPAAVQAAAEAYGQVAEVSVEPGADDIVVRISADEDYGEELFDAFANHALYETIVRSRQQLGGP